MDASQAILSGLAPDGGLYMMDRIPRLELTKIMQQDVYGMAETILSALLPSIENMGRLVRQAYDHKFRTPELTPTRPVGPYGVLELFHGPTSAFKDVALCMLPQLISAAKQQKMMEDTILILTATSGDTGKAALAGFQDVPGIKICVFYPHGGVSAVQRAQMVTQRGENVKVCAVQGNFDDAQTGVKNIFAADAKDNLAEEKGVRLSSANSINIGRLAPQVTYYFKSYQDLLAAGTIQMGDEVNFTVPTGNFGDILAGYLAKCMGLPVGKLICASNANNVLTDFIRTGLYDRRRPLLKTQSPSMDILISSNLERMLYLLSGNNTDLIAALMSQLSKDGFYQISDEMLTKLQSEFWAGCCDDETSLQTIRRVWEDHHYVCDTHTAVAWNVAEQYQKETGDDRPMVVLSTASPYKFPASVLSALRPAIAVEDAIATAAQAADAIAPEKAAAIEDEFEQMNLLSSLTGTEIPPALAELSGLPERHLDVIAKDAMLDYVLNI